MSSTIRRDSLHLFRSILREASYLPDVEVRQYVHTRARQMFQKAQQRYNLQIKRGVDIDKQFIRTRLRNGRASLHALERANTGYHDPLLKIFNQAYGRAGPLRRQLLAELRTLQPGETPVDSPSASKRKQQEVKGSERNKYMLQSPRFMAVFRSQVLNPPSLRTKLRRLEPDIPKLNSWLRPMPKRRLKGLYARWWKRVYAVILPPPPEATWARLRDLASGLTPLEMPPPRRTKITQEKSPLADFRSWNLPIATALDFRKSRYSISRRAGTAITKRSLQRLYGDIWSLCPRLTFEPGKTSPVVEWGKVKSFMGQGKYKVPTTADMVLFEGLLDSEKDI